MKTIIHIRYALLLALLMGSVSGRMTAQEAILDCQSRIYRYDTVSSTHSIIRRSGNLQVIQTQFGPENISNYTHSFIVKDDQTGLERIFDVDFHDHNSADPNYVNITDMVIYGGICYFCGTIVYDGGAPVMDPFGNILIPRFICHGIVGRFSISAVLSDLGQVDYVILDEVKRLHRLAANRPLDNDYTVVIHLIGDIGNVEDTSCLLELQHTTSLDWTKTLDYIPTQPEIIFTDIVANSWNFIMSSRMKCPDDNPASTAPTAYNHRVFNLQEFSLYGCSHDLTYPYTIAPMQRYLIPSTHIGWHYDQTPMSLCCVGYEQFALAFGVRNEPYDIGGIRVFIFGSPDNCQSYYYKTGFKGEVMDICYHPLTWKISVLSKDNTHPKGLVSISHLDVPAIVDYLYPYDHTLTSLEVEYDSRLKVSGYNTSSHELSLYKQYVDSLHLASCFEKGQIERSDFIDLEAEDRYPDWRYRFRNKPFEWKSKKVEARATSPSTECKECPY